MTNHLIVLAVALVQANDERNTRAQHELLTCLLATTRALPRDVVDAAIAAVNAPVLVVEPDGPPLKETP